jgi:hypothetical protein
MAERKLARVPLKVVHRHRIGGQVFKRVSELAYVHGQPKAILRWIDIAGIRTPIYADLDAGKLRRMRPRVRVTLYDGTTTDPSDVVPKPPTRGRRRRRGEVRPGGRRWNDPPAASEPLRR